MTDGHMQTTLRKAFSSPAKLAKRRSKPTPVSVRFTADEKAKIKRDAAEKPLSSYIRECVLRAGTSTDTFASDRDRKPELARVLAALGRSNLARDFENLSFAVRDGTVQLSAESETALRQACADIAAMRRDLLKALGLRPD